VAQEEGVLRKVVNRKDGGALKAEQARDFLGRIPGGSAEGVLRLLRKTFATDSTNKSPSLFNGQSVVICGIRG
jgi:hypothetical protein